MIELIFLSILVLLYLYSYVYNYISAIGVAITVFVSLKIGVDPLIVWLGLYFLTVVRIVKPRFNEE